MKRLITTLFLVCSLCLLLAACNGLWHQKDKTFDEEFLKALSLEDMPLPESERYSLNTMVSGQETLEADIDREGFEAYVKAFVEYMGDRNDIYYFGIEKHEGLIGEIAPHNVVYQIKDDHPYADSDKFVFCYSQSAETTTVSSCEHLHYAKMTSVTIDYDSEKGVVSIEIDADENSSCIDDEMLTPDLSAAS